MFLLLGTISLAPVIGSLLLYYVWQPQAFTNYGELVTAIPLAGVTIAASDDKPLRIDELRGNWVFLMADTAHCDDYCQSKLYVMRQVRLAQGKDQLRIERVWLVQDGVRPSPGIEAEYRGTRTLLPAAGDFLARLPASGSPRDHIYVIDPFGNLMMRFPRDADPQRVKKDVAKLMKNSSGWIRTAN